MVARVKQINSLVCQEWQVRRSHHNSAVKTLEQTFINFRMGNYELKTRKPNLWCSARSQHANWTTGETESHSSTPIYHALYIFILARSLHSFSIKKPPQLPESYLREVVKIALSCGHRSGMMLVRDVSWILTASAAQPVPLLCQIQPLALLTFPIMPAKQGGHFCREARKQQQDGQHSHAPSSGDTGTKNELAHLFAWIQAHAHTLQRLLVTSSPVCHGLPQCSLHFNSIIFLMSFCFLQPWKCFWIWQQE